MPALGTPKPRLFQGYVIGLKVRTIQPISLILSPSRPARIPPHRRRREARVFAIALRSRVPGHHFRPGTARNPSVVVGSGCDLRGADRRRSEIRSDHRRVMSASSLVAIAVCLVLGVARSLQTASATPPLSTTTVAATPSGATATTTTGVQGAVTADLFVAPNGSDSNNCLSSSAPCLTFDHAYHLAQPGQTVLMAAGVYGPQSITVDASKNCGVGANVVFMPGGTVTLPNSTLSDHGVSCGGSTGSRWTSLVARTRRSRRAVPRSSRSATRRRDVVLDNVHASRFFVTGGSFVTITNSDFGPAYDFHGIIHATTQSQGFARPHDILLRNACHDPRPVEHRAPAAQTRPVSARTTYGMRDDQRRSLQRRLRQCPRL